MHPEIVPKMSPRVLTFNLNTGKIYLERRYCGVVGVEPETILSCYLDTSFRG